MSAVTQNQNVLENKDLSSENSIIKAKPCACKGIRTCIKCEQAGAIRKKEDHPEEKTYFFCPACQDYAYMAKDHKQHSEILDRLYIPGVYVQAEFVTKQEEDDLCRCIDQLPWVDSQSGRRKHDFGPKVNFKKQKLKSDAFKGFPKYSEILLSRLNDVPVLRDFFPVEMCNLEYCPERGSAIDPHFDDFWLWGERLVTVNLLSETCYTLSKTGESTEIQISIPPRSLVVLYGAARYQWMHSIKRKHISWRRIGITIRELTPKFLRNGEHEDVGSELLQKAKTNSDYFAV